MVVPTIAEGNPATQISARLQAERNGIDVDAICLNIMGWAGSHMHAGMTKDPARAEKYSINSEEERLNFKAMVFSVACAGELTMRAWKEREVSDRFNFFQEHPLLGSPHELLDRLGAEQVRIFVPDVHPKESAVEALRRKISKRPAEFVVWNTEAEKALCDMGMPVSLKKPFMLDGFRPDLEEFAGTGSEVVVKASGSGMPSNWEREIIAAFLSKPRSENAPSWAIHTQQTRIKENKVYPWLTEREWRIRDFYQSLGGPTRLLVSFPTELVGVVSDMRERGVPTWMLAMPTRGAHEVRNLDFAIRNGLLLGYLGVGRYEGMNTLDGLPVIKPEHLEGLVRELRTEKVQWRPGIVGTEKMWD